MRATLALPIAVLGTLLLVGPVNADEEQLEFFEKKIRPVLVDHCYQCHAADAKKVRGGLLLDSKEGIRAGGESGPGIVPNEPAESLILDALRHESFEMPPSGKLDDQVIADFEHWISNGAIDPRKGSAPATVGIDIEEGKKFWSFRPILSVDVPSVSDSEWAESAIDLFLLSRREREGIPHVGDANRTTLVRRVYYALIGMPPTPDEINEFVANEATTPEAMAKLVDRLLESKHFGERWGRHWLDVVRFAESSGGGRTLLFPEAWRYRDYVIDAFNEDMPYDQFLREQVAGDLLPSDDYHSRGRQLTATAFLLLGPTNYELQDKDVLEMDIVDEQIDTIGKAFMGMTVGCARCHDHKFDPIPMRDYYAMAGILKNTKSVIHSNVSTWNTVNLPVEEKLELELTAHETKVAETEQQLKKAKAQLKKLESAVAIEVASLPGIVIDDSAAEKIGNWVDSTVVTPFVGAGYIHDDGKRDTTCEVRYRPILKPGRYEVRVSYTPGGNRSTKAPFAVHHKDGITNKTINQTKQPKSSPFVSLGEFEFTGSNSQGRAGAEQTDNESASDGFEGVVVSNTGAAEGVLIADAVQFLAVGEAADNESIKPKRADKHDSEDIQSAKKVVKQLESQLAELKKSGPQRPIAMASVDEPEVHDIHLAIRGVVANKGPVVPRGVLQVALNRKFPAIDEGQSGRLQLADWITDPTNPLTARVIVNRVWYWLYGEGLVRSVDNFGSMGTPPSHPELLDYLAESFIADGWSIKRLIRRLMLSRTYRLDSTSSQSSVGAEKDPSNHLLWKMNRRRLDAESIRDSLLSVAQTLDLTAGGSNIKGGTKIEYDYVFDSPRRSVYLPVFRNTLPDIFANFDFADPNIQGGRRTTSTIAPQALLLMNHPFVIEQTQKAADRLRTAKDSKDSTDKIAYCYQQVLGRRPTENETKLAAQFVADDQDGDRWSLLYQTLFQSLDFRYVK